MKYLDKSNYSSPQFLTEKQIEERDRRTESILARADEGRANYEKQKAEEAKTYREIYLRHREALYKALGREPPPLK